MKSALAALRAVAAAVVLIVSVPAWPTSGVKSSES
ncbi:Uncharacterised protein [Klebsiella pneumoniae]|nr:Uncharacterised protein [Klebsiella pneumoniae]